jgi:hypothetical protein
MILLILYIHSFHYLILNNSNFQSLVHLFILKFRFYSTFRYFNLQIHVIILIIDYIVYHFHLESRIFYIHFNLNLQNHNLQFLNSQNHFILYYNLYFPINSPITKDNLTLIQFNYHFSINFLTY